MTGGSVRTKLGPPHPEEPVVRPPSAGSGAELEATEGLEAGRHAYESLVALCRTDVNAFCEFVLRDEETGRPVEQSAIHVEMQRAYEEARFVVVLSFPESGKAVPLRSEIPTPNGWTTMGRLRVGDEVFDRRGEVVRVTWCSPVQRKRDVYEVEWDDGVVEKADADHRWLARVARPGGGGPPRALEVITTRDMTGELRVADGRYRYAMPVTGAARYPERALPLHPYVLGAWLGDGTRGSADLTFSETDRFIWDLCHAYEPTECEPRPDKRRPHVLRGTLGGVQGGRGPHGASVYGRLRRLGVLFEKRIPEEYITASVEQRRDLLAGLMDTDGSVDRGPSGGCSRVELTLTSRLLAGDAVELVRSLGYKASIRESDAVLDGRVVGRRWRICWTARDPLFRLPRKLARQQLGHGPRTGAALWRRVIAVRRVETEPVRCIQVDSPDHTYLLGRGYAVTHNTQNLVVGRTLHELGRDPTERHVFLNNGQDGAKKSLGAVKKYVERSEELRAVFPGLRPGGLWREDAVTVEGAGLSKDPSIYCLGFHGNITGARIDRAKVDDLLDFENTRTVQSRADVESWFKRTFMTRLTGKASVAFLTNAWHEEDLAHVLEDEGWRILRYPVLDASGRSMWPERWSLGRIAEWRRRFGPLEFARSFMCEPRDPGAMSFRPEWLRAALRRGVGYSLVDQIGEPPPGALIVTGCDLGASRRMTGGATTMFTTCFHARGLRQLVAARSGRWSGGDVIRNLADVGERYGGVIVVEDNGIQRHVVELANEEGMSVPVPVLPFYTGRNKYDVTLGVDAMAAEFEAGRWMLPSGRSGRDAPEEVRRLLGEMRAYSPGCHPGDRLMGVWFARTWALRRLRAMQRGGDGGGKVTARVLGGREDRASREVIRERVRALTGSAP